jgi:hypothetical protein
MITVSEAVKAFVGKDLTLAPLRCSACSHVPLYGAGTLEHPDKTFIGRIERGFTFLGCWITKQGATRVAPSA